MLYYGFALLRNKYNFAYFRMSLMGPKTKLEEVYKESLIEQLLHTKAKSRRFRLYYQQLNTCNKLI